MPEPDPLLRWRPYSATSRIVAAVLPLHRQMTPHPPPVIGIIEPKRKPRRLPPKQAIKQVAELGIELTIAADGSMTFRPLDKDVEPAPANEVDAWIKKHARN